MSAPNPSVESILLNYAAGKLTQLGERVVTCIGKLTPDQIWMRGSENQNAVGNLVLHLHGNVRQWIIGGVGGQISLRDRDAEFSARGGADPAQLSARLQETVAEAAVVIRELPAARLTERLTIQGHDVCVLEAICHVTEHFSGHVAQIIFVTKMLTGEDLGFYSYLQKPEAGQGRMA